MPVVKYRSYHENLRPRRTRLEVPGWAGQSDPRADGSGEYPWHCIPFSEAVSGGLELTFPHDTQLRVANRRGALYFEGDFSGPDDPRRPPFRPFSRGYFTYQSLVDLKVEPGYAIKIETHPSFYTDTTGTVPIAVPAIVRHWWPMIYFVVFKSPAEGQTHIFRPGQPFIQFSVVSADGSIDLIDMPEDEAAERELQSRHVYAGRSTLSAETTWTSSTDTVFDGTYRRLFGAARSRKAD